MSNDLMKQLRDAVEFAGSGYLQWDDGADLIDAAAARIRELEAELQAAVAAEREACAEIARLAMNAAHEKRNQGGSKVQLAHASMALVIFRRIRYRALIPADQEGDG